MSGRASGSTARAELLAAVVEYAADHGLSDVTLRQMAAAIGSSHRMLIYHFGSKEGLLVAVVEEVERRQRERLAGLGADPHLTPAEVVRRMWRELADPSMWRYERLFYELYASALQGRPGTVPLLHGIVDDWLEPASEVIARRGIPADEARPLARLGLAVTRGLLLDLLATGDRAGCDAAIERYIAALPRELAGPTGTG